MPVRLPGCLLLCSIIFLFTGCKSTPTDPAAEAAEAEAKVDAASGPATAGATRIGAGSLAGAATGGNVEKADVGFLLSMNYDEAKKLSPQSLIIPPFYKVSADEITVLKRTEAGQPLRVRAKGHVFLQIDFRDQLIALGQEAYIASGGEIIMRGKPLLKRGRSVVEGLSDYTVFYIRGLRLQVIGSHRLAKQEAPVVVPVEGGRDRKMPSWNVTPNWQRSWQDGPNPILPALSPEDVPPSMRTNLLLPPPDAVDTPRQLPAGTPPASSAPKEKARGKEKDTAPGAPAMKVPDLEPFSPFAPPSSSNPVPPPPDSSNQVPSPPEPPKQ